MQVIAGIWPFEPWHPTPAIPGAIYLNHYTAQAWRDGQGASFTRTQFKFLCAILAPRGHFASHEAITDGMYGDREDGGVDNPTTNRLQHTLHVRRKLKPLGMSIEAFWGVGLRAVAA